MVRQNTIAKKFSGGISQETPAEMWNRPDAVPNMEGGLAFKMDDYNELVMRTISCFFGEPDFYQKVDETTGIIQAKNQNHELLQIAQRVALADPKFVLQLAAYARNVLHLRTIPVILWTEVAILHGLKKIPGLQDTGEYIEGYAPAILKRADEPAEALAYYIAKNGSFLGNGARYPQFARKGVVLVHAMRKGIEEAIFTNFDHYQLSKYNRKNAAVKQKDMINLVHPNTNKNHEAFWNGGREYWNTIFQRLLDGTLPPAETWEDTLMRWKEKGFSSKKDAWEAIIPKMGYMALLRNLRNMIEANIHPTMMETVFAKLRNPEEVKKSKQFPFRFYTAYKMIEQMSFDNTKYQQKAQSALEDAMDASLNNNLPRWPGHTAVVADFSGSMDHRMSSNSVVSLKEVAALFMVMSSKLCEDAESYIFADYAQQVNIHERSGVLDNVQRLLAINVGTSTEAWTIMSDFISNNKQYDRMVLFSDMQCYNVSDRDRVSRSEGEEGGWSYHRWQIAPLWNRYKRVVNPNAYLYSMNLADYGASIVPIDTYNLFLGGGFSDRILEFVPLFESTRVGLIEKIKAVKPYDFYKKHPQRIEKTLDKSPERVVNDDDVSDDIPATTEDVE
jgi:hypothetical protein